MALQNLENVEIKGIAACVPSLVENNREISIFANAEDSNKFIESTGIEERHVVKGSGLCASDLCLAAAEKLLIDINWDRSEIDCLIFVSQTPDYILPATSCILQAKLGLKTECFALDISLGCSGWIYGLSTISALLSAGGMKKGLLLAGDTTSVTKSPKDKSTYPLFGDAGTATAIEFRHGGPGIKIHTGTDGSGFDSIIIRDGGFRNPFSVESLNEYEVQPGIIRNNLQSSLNGPSVFTFGITKAPKSIQMILDHYQVEKDSIDFFLLHQANLFMNEKIRQKLKVGTDRVPYSLGKYGNTSCASIPLTIVSELGEEVKKRNLSILACGFGVGLSWGSAVFQLNHIVCPAVIEI